MVWLCAKSVGAASTAANKAAFIRMARIIILELAAMVKTAFAALLVAGTLASATLVRGVRLQPDREQDWPFYGGDQGGTKYSPLADVNASTVSRLQTAWEWQTREKALEPFGTRPGN